jgi:hypothetical protein
MFLILDFRATTTPTAGSWRTACTTSSSTARKTSVSKKPSPKQIATNGGQCYDHYFPAIFTKNGLFEHQCFEYYFRLFSPIFGKNVLFLEHQLWSILLHKLAVFWVRKGHFCAQIFRRKHSKNHNIGPWAIACAGRSIPVPIK